MQESEKVKLIAMYFTQLHAIPENDEWWGKGFTDWVNVKKAEPRYEGHYQPRVPLDNNYYDQSQIDTIRAQIELAKKYGLYGFCHYHYWFDGKQLLETPTNIVLDNPELDFPFCLSWANETWSKRWDGRNHDILIKQTHPPTEESWEKHFQYLIRAWSDPRAIKIDNKPVFVIYRPFYIEKIGDMIAYWNKRAKEHGLVGLYIVAQKQYEFPNRECVADFDALFQFQPFEAMLSHELPANVVQNRMRSKLLDMLPGWLREWLRDMKMLFKKRLVIYDYDRVWKDVIAFRPDDNLRTFQGAFVDWDNTARYGHHSTTFKGANPERFEYWFTKLVDVVGAREENERYIFLNAWNEWAEGTYLEPDEKYQYQYLEAVKKALKKRLMIAHV
jgi:hypothetical protein